MAVSSPGSRKIPSHLGHSSTTTSRLTLQKCRIMTIPVSRGQVRRFSGSTFVAGFCSLWSSASPADWSGWSTLRSVHSSNHNPPQPPLQAWIFTSLTAISVIWVPQAGQFMVTPPWPRKLLDALRYKQAIPHRDHRRNPTRVCLNAPGQLSHTTRRGTGVAALEDAPTPQHVVDQEQPTRPQLGHDDIERLGVILFVDVVEDDVERAGRVTQRRDRLPHVKSHHIDQADGGEVVARLAGQLLVPHDMVHGATAVVLHGAREPRGRVAEPRAELEDLSSVAQACQQVAQLSRGGAEEGEAGAPRRRFQLREPHGARRYECVQIRRHARGHEVHPIPPLSVCDKSTSAAARPPSSPPARTTAPG